MNKQSVLRPLTPALSPTGGEGGKNEPHRVSLCCAWLSFILWLPFAVAGCLPELIPNPEAGAPDPPYTQSNQVSPSVAVEVVTMTEFDAELANHEGKIVVLDCWATYCVPCLREFHNLVELHDEYGDKGVVCLSLSLDYQGDEEVLALSEKVLKFLESQQATTKNYLASEPADDVYAHLGFGAVPAVFVYTPDGDREKFTPKGEDDAIYERVNARVAKLLE